MIQLKDRVNVFATIGKLLKELSEDEIDYIYRRAGGENSWFTEKNVSIALEGVIRYLDEDKLEAWTNDLPANPVSPKKVGVVMAGNIPLVGFHDMLAVLISGHKLLAKPSSKDAFLIKYVADLICDIEPWFGEQISFQERLNDAEAMIATGSDNSSRYFEYYFSKIPHIIRRNRSSVGVLSGKESPGEFKALGNDVFQYFGLGCRNVSKLFVPKGYDFGPLLDAWQVFDHVAKHHKYNNNYDYNKSIYLVNKELHYDSGFALLRRSEQLVSPISVVYYEEYSHSDEITKNLAGASEKIQCVVSQNSWVPGSLPFGKAQEPELWDYADNVNTLVFLQQLN